MINKNITLFRVNNSHFPMQIDTRAAHIQRYGAIKRDNGNVMRRSRAVSLSQARRNATRFHSKKSNNAFACLEIRVLGLGEIADS